ncbi:MAG TPA: T9SS type A sorting domain-containing protein [Prolixibacteraceae bacterium]|nr:T9SS type A sorting domain-containing protein [Prolixibacteraceae bacterium]
MKKDFFLLIILIVSFLEVYPQMTGYDLSHIVMVSGTPNPVAGIEPKDEAQLLRDSTLDVVNWNVTWMGAPQMVNNKYGDREAHIDGIARKLVETDADVYALQEVVVDAINGNALTDLLSRMNTLTGTEKYSGLYSPYYSFWWQDYNPEYPPQCLAFIWNNETISVNNDSILLQGIASSNDFGYGRLPFLLDADVTINGKTQRYMFVNIHLKASTGYSDMRAGSMELLKELLNVNFHANNVVLLGDYNNADERGALGEIRSWGMYADDEKDGLADYVHAAGNKGSGIEHILVSNELFDELAYVPEYLRSRTISGTGILLSDHYAYETQLYIHEETGGADPESNPLFSSESSFTLTKADYRIIVDYVKNDPVLSVLDTNPYEDSEYYFGASAYYSNFDTRNGKYHSSFATWEEAVKTAIALALLPAKYPNATVDGTHYAVTFDTYSGVAGQSTFTFICVSSAPGPEFAAYNENNSPVFPFPDGWMVYPNPARGAITVSSHSLIGVCSLIDLQGRCVQTCVPANGHLFTLDISSVPAGLYSLRIFGSTGGAWTRKLLVK